jgi:integrase
MITEGNRDVKQLLSDAVDDYLNHRLSRGLAASTIRNEKAVLKKFLSVIGNVYVENVHEEHIDRHFRAAGESRSPQSLTVDDAALKAFFRWAHRTRRTGRHGDPIAGRPRPRFTPREWRGISIGQVPAILDHPRHPRDRALLALVVYTLGRSVELTDLKIEDLHLDTGGLSYRIPKTRKVDILPISSELDAELRRWLKVYAEECGTLQPHWFLVPGKSRPRVKGGVMLENSSVLIPTKRLKSPYRIAQAALSAVGFPLRDSDGKSRREGMHTIRRSVARALYEQLRDEGDPNPVETVRATLNHSTEKMTRVYIGLESDRVHRDARLRGKPMFPGLAADNVTKLGVAGGSPDRALRRVTRDG